MARILLITNIFPPLIGGPAIFIDRLATRLTHAGHQVTVICSSEGMPPEGYDKDRAFNICRIDLSNRYLYEIKVRLMIAYHMLRHKLILVNGLETYVGFVTRFINRRFILKVVGDSVWEQGRNWGILTDSFDEFQTRTTPPKKLQGLKAARQNWLAKASRIVTPGAWMGETVARWGIPPDKIKVIPNGVPLHAFQDAQIQPRTGILDVLFIGRLTNWKGVETLLLAMQGITGIRLTIIGDGPELPMLTALAQQLKLGDAVLFSGKVEQSLLHQRLMAAHVLTLPSNYEGLSHTLLEAAAAGLARIASDIGGNRDAIKHDETGWLLPYGDVEAWKHALIRLRDDEDTRQRLAKAALTDALSFNFDTSVDAYVSLLEQQS